MKAETEIVPELLSKAMVCRLLASVSEKHIDNLVRRGSMPEPVYLDRHPRWPRAVILKWIEDGCPVVDSEKHNAWRRKQDEENATLKRKRAKRKSTAAR